MEEVFCVSYLCGTCGALDFSIILNGKQGKTLSDVFRLYCKFFFTFFFFNNLHLPLELCDLFFCLLHIQRTTPNMITITVRLTDENIRAPKKYRDGET